MPRAVPHEIIKLIDLVKINIDILGGSSYIPDFSNFAANFPSNLEDIQRQSERFANIHGRSGGAPLPEDLGYRGLD